MRRSARPHQQQRQPSRSNTRRRAAAHRIRPIVCADGTCHQTCRGAGHAPSMIRKGVASPIAISVLLVVGMNFGWFFDAPLLTIVENALMGGGSSRRGRSDSLAISFYALVRIFRPGPGRGIPEPGKWWPPQVANHRTRNSVHRKGREHAARGGAGESRSSVRRQVRKGSTSRRVEYMATVLTDRRAKASDA